MNQKKPGVMLYFELLPVFEQMDVAQVGELTMSILRYAKDSKEPEFQSDVTRLVWAMVKSRVDNDDSKYSHSVLNKRYAGYVSVMRRKGAPESEIMGFEEWAKHVDE